MGTRDSAIADTYEAPAIKYEKPLIVYCGILEPNCGSPNGLQPDPWALDQ